MVLLQGICYRNGSVTVASIKNTLNSLIVKAEQRAVAEYTAKLRSHATSYGWPSEITDNLKISHDGERHAISYPQGIEDAVLTLEYGTQKVPPSPALRTFVLGIK